MNYKKIYIQFYDGLCTCYDEKSNAYAKEKKELIEKSLSKVQVLLSQMAERDFSKKNVKRWVVHVLNRLQKIEQIANYGYEGDALCKVIEKNLEETSYFIQNYDKSWIALEEKVNLKKSIEAPEARAKAIHKL